MANHLTGLLIACTIVMSASSQANAMHGMHGDTSCTTKVTREYGFIFPGFSRAGIAKVNDIISNQEIASLKISTPTLPIGGHKEIRRMHTEVTNSSIQLKERLKNSIDPFFKE